jgi:tetratricopeptide (TPR) repeat protein
VSLRSTLERLRAPLTERRVKYTRVPDVDVPSVPVELSVFATAPKDATAHVAFGAIEQGDLRPIDALVARTEGRDQAIEAWHGAFDVENGNFGKAATLLERVANREPTAQHWLLLGDAQLLSGQPAEAAKSYQRTLAFGPSASAEKGMGWALVGTKDYDGALVHFQRARDGYAEVELVRPRAGYLDALRGSVIATARKGDCVAAHALEAEIKSEAPSFPPPTLEECK